MLHRLAIALSLLTTVTVVRAADPKPPENKPENKHAITFLDPEKAGVDYALQGE